MTELKTERGYFMTLGAMAFLTVILLIYFWRRGWIFQGDAEIVIPKKPERPEEDFENS